MKKILALLGTIAINQLCYAVTPVPTVNGAPQAGVYYNSNGTYGGTTMTVNGGTSYYNNGQYQGQAPANTPIFQNRNQNAIINSETQTGNSNEQLMNSTPADGINSP